MSGEWLRPGDPRAKRILILGGGFAGVYAAYELHKARKESSEPVEISIVNRENFFVFYPLLAEIISGAVEIEDVLTPIRLVVPDANLYVGDVTAIDLDQSRVEIRHGLYRHKQEARTLFYDHLVIALGGIPATSRIPGLAEYAFDVQRLSHAFSLRNHLLDTLEQADIETNPLRKRRNLSYVVVGGGGTGVEVAAEIQSMLHDVSRYYRHVEPEDVRVVIVQGGERLIPDLPEQLGTFAARILSERGMEIRFGRRVSRVEPGVVHLDDGETIEADTIVGAVGVEVNPLVRDLPLPHDRQGRVAVQNTLRASEERPNVWVIGDAARVIDPHTGEPYPQTAQ
ncbi:MAG TPA: FAD-dependent oxidoreductase, partial [Dehalococcoidia bacterium]|nr:FAD-dependent oxidoreductase [Dehalococcoidia bacterium]